MTTAQIITALADFLTAYTATTDAYSVIYTNGTGGAIRVAYSEKAGEFRVADAVNNTGGYFHHNPKNVAGAVARRLG